MAIQASVTVKGATINNAYLKIMRTNIKGVLVPAKPASGSTPATPASTKWNGSVILGIFADKTHADASVDNAIDTTVVQIPNALTLPNGANVIADIYTWLMTLPQYAGATAV